MGLTTLIKRLSLLIGIMLIACVGVFASGASSRLNRVQTINEGDEYNNPYYDQGDTRHYFENKLAMWVALGEFAAPYFQQSIVVPNCTGTAATDTATLTALKTALGTSVPATIAFPRKTATASYCKVNTISFPASLALDFTNGGIQVVTGQTLTIVEQPIAPPRKIFYNALSGQGAVAFTGNVTAYPQWWGADGLTDDTPSWNASVLSGAKIVSGASGSFKIDTFVGVTSRCIQPPSNITLDLTGATFTAIDQGLAGANAIILLDNKSNVTIIAGTFVGVGGNDEAYGILIAGGSNIRVKDANFSGFTYDGVGMQSSNGVIPDGVTASNLYSHHNDRQGLSVVNGTNITILGGTFTFNGGNGIDIETEAQKDSVNGVQISGVTSTDNVAGMNIVGNGVKVDRATIKNNSAGGVWISRSTLSQSIACALTNSQVEGNGGFAVKITAPGALVANNHIRDNLTGDGVLLENTFSPGFTIANNVITGNGLTGIVNNAGNPNGRIIGNYIANNGLDGISTSSSYTTISDNTVSSFPRTVVDAVTNGTTTITSATAVFTSADVGDRVVLSGGGSLSTTISSVTNATTAVLNSGAGWSTSGNRAVITRKGNRTGIFVNTNTVNNVVSGNTVVENGRWGIIFVSGVVNSQLIGNIADSNSQETDLLYANFALGDNSNNNNVQHNISRKGSLTNKPSYGIHVMATCDANIVKNNDLVTAGQTANLLDAGTNTIIAGNPGFLTHNSGTATVLNTTTSIVVNHGLATTPALADIKVTPTNNLGSAAKFWISTVTSTQFTINVNADPGAGTATFVWNAEITTP